jgi:hypothetical protein
VRIAPPAIAIAAPPATNGPPTLRVALSIAPVTCLTGLVFFDVDRRPRPLLLAPFERRLAVDFDAARLALGFDAARLARGFDAARLARGFDAARLARGFDAARSVLLLELLRLLDWRVDCAMGSSSGGLGVLKAC